MPQVFMQFPYSLVTAIAVIIALAHAQPDQSDFISIDCGTQLKSDYTHGKTFIRYTPDTDYIDTGESKAVPYATEQEFLFIRVFPKGTRNCYKVNIKKGQKYLVRASFGYGNYDGAGTLPKFELHLGTNLWETVEVTGTPILFKEIIHVPHRDYLHICLVNVNKGVPFISSIELRPLRNDAYQTEAAGTSSLEVMARQNIVNDGFVYRYPVDAHDRIWGHEFNSIDWKGINAASLMKADQSAYQLPAAVTSTAATPISTGISTMEIRFKPGVVHKDATYYIYMHFAELQIVQTGSSRELTVSINENAIAKPFQPKYLTTTTINATIPADTTDYTFTIYSPDMVYQPIVNAYEIYMGKEFLESETNQEDVEAMENIKSSYKITRNWQGDPCYPQDYVWEGVKCSYSGYDYGRIISLDLSSSTLSGVIAASIAKLAMIQTLDLSKNKLSGTIPEFLSSLPKLNTLNLEENELTGSVPTELKRKKLSLSLCGNPNLLKQPAACGKKKNKFLVPVASSVSAVALFLLTVAGVLLFKGYSIRDTWRRRKLGKGPNEVFLSFRGTDTGKGFTYNLYVALCNRGIKSYYANEKLIRGSKISQALLAAIRESKISVAILSEKYTESHWCLEELAMIYECQKIQNQHVFPVFYYVEPNTVRRQSGSFNLDRYREKQQENIPKWKEALTEVGALAGVAFPIDFKSEAEAIKDIVEELSKILKIKKGDKLETSQSV